MLSPPGARAHDAHTNTTIPVLESVMNDEDAKQEINKLKPYKVCGPDGVSPGLLVYFRQSGLLFWVHFSTLFFSVSYPESWTKAAVLTLFKKGNRIHTNDNRNITLITVTVWQSCMVWFCVTGSIFQGTGRSAEKTGMCSTHHPAASHRHSQM